MEEKDMNNQEKKYELIKFEDGEVNLDVKVSSEEDTVWLNQKDLIKLFNVDKSRISRHIKNILHEGELDSSVVAENATTGSDGKTYITKYYNLDMIIAVGYRVKSKRGILFRDWAFNKIDELKNQNTQKGLISQYILFNYDEIKLNVNVSPNENTVWLNKEQLIILFDTTRQNLEYHINNIYSQNELDELATCKKILQVQIENNREVTRNVNIYNLDMIISLGFRINSKRGIIFRQWANKILKQYLLNGYAINTERIMAYQSNILQLEANVINIENRLKNLEMTIYSDNTQIIFEGEILEPYTFLRKLFFLARNEITIIDQYADKFLLTMLSDLKVKITIITSSSSYLNKEIIPNNITIIHNDIIHDRFIIIDDLVYAIGSSFNDIGKKRFFMMKLENITKEMILQERKKD
jgi:hypothetical protein